MSDLRWIPIHDKIYITILVTLIVQTQYTDGTEHRRPTREYLKMSVEEKIRYLGYPCDLHDLTTPDGYHLRLYRISYGINPTKNFKCDGEYIHVETGSDYVEGDSDEEYSNEDTDEEKTKHEEDENIDIDIIGKITETSTAKEFTSSTSAKPVVVTAKTPPPLRMSTTFKKLFTSTRRTTTSTNTSTPSSTSFTTRMTTKLNIETPPGVPTTLKPTSTTKKPDRKPRKTNGESSRNRNSMLNGESLSGKSVVLLLHGMLGGPSNFLHNGRDALAFYFADRGFDVWILCFRGCYCGQKKYHDKYSTGDKEYWDFSFHHMSTTDVPTAIDYILPITNQSSVHMIGHSAGTIIQIIFLSERPEYGSKVKIGSQYGGSVFLGLSDYPSLQFGSSLVRLFKGVHKFFGWTTIVPGYLVDLFMAFIVETCYNDEYFHICEGMNSLVASHNSVLIDKYASIAVLLHDSQGHLSPKEVFHFMQMMYSGEFAKYDYGKKRNLREYGQETPPSYNFSRVTNPVILHYSPNDHFGNLDDLKRAVSLMPNVIQVYKVPFWRFTHTDYILGQNASKLVYENTCKMFKRYDAGERFQPLKEVDIEEPVYY